jgi:hypothetical protein
MCHVSCVTCHVSRVSISRHLSVCLSGNFLLVCRFFFRFGENQIKIRLLAQAPTDVSSISLATHVAIVINMSTVCEHKYRALCTQGTAVPLYTALCTQGTAVPLYTALCTQGTAVPLYRALCTQGTAVPLCQADPEGRFSCYPFSTLVIEREGCSGPRPGCLTSGRDSRYPLYRKLGGSRGR